MISTHDIAVAIASAELTSVPPLHDEDPDSHSIQCIAERLISSPKGGRETALQKDCFRAANAIIRMMRRQKVKFVDVI